MEGDNGPAIRAVCSQFVTLCRRLNLFTQAVVAIDGSKFKAVNNRDKNFTVAKLKKRIEQVDASIAVTWRHWTGPTATRAMSLKSSRSA